MSWKKVKLGQVLKQYRIEHWVQNDAVYKQVTISKHTGVRFRGEKLGKEIGRKRQFIIDLEQYPKTLLFVRQGVEDGSIGLAPQEVHGCIATENMPMFSVEGIDPEYLKLVLQSKEFRQQLSLVPSLGSAQKAVHERDLLQLEIPFPSPEEQSQLVEDYRRFSYKQGELFTNLDTQQTYLTNLRQAFLREAMQGQLVPQDPTDEPAAALLARIRAEKADLIKAGKLRKEKPLPSITEAEIPYDLPVGWEWCRVDEVCESITDCVNKTAKVVDYKTPYKMLRTTNVRDGKLDTKNVRYVTEETYLVWTRRDRPQVGDIILTREAPLGEVGKVNEEDTLFLGQRLVQYRADLTALDSTFLLHLFQSATMQKQFDALSAGAFVKHLRVPDSKNLLLPLPPLAEQHRIVAKLEQLLAQCDALEASIRTSRTHAEQLLQAALREALAPPVDASGVGEEAAAIPKPKAKPGQQLQLL